MEMAEKREQARRELDERLKDIRAFAEDGETFDGVYGLGYEKVVTLTLAGGGPSAWIEYWPERETATFFTTAPDYANSSETVAIPLTPEEVSDIWSYGYVTEDQ